MSRDPPWAAEAREWARTAQRGRNLWRRAVAGPPAVGLTPADLIHRENKWRLLRYRARAAPAGTGGPDGPRDRRPPVGSTVAPGSADPAPSAPEAPVLLVPSLINRHYVLDLAPGRSFAEYLVGQGHDVFIIDWGRPGREDRHLSFADFALGYLGRAVRRTLRAAGAPRLHLFGYCLGGTLTAVYAARHPEQLASLIGLAAPIDFHTPGLLESWVRSPTFDVGALTAAFGNVPWPLMQLAFHLLRPTLTLSKTVHLVDQAWDDEFLDGFVALERWGNDNVSFPGRAYREYVQSFYRDNALVKGTYHIDGVPLRLEAITCPTLVISFEHGNIVPGPSAAALHARVGSPDREHWHLPGGHVGAVVSRKAAQGLWSRLSAWLRARDPGAASADG